MPVITPAYPSMCATHNVTMSTRKIITKELARASDIVNNKIFNGHLAWENLFEKHTFFTEGYKYYLSIVSASRTKEAQQIWSGLVESKVRHLVTDLENDSAIEIAHPFNKGFERVHECRNEEEIEVAISGDSQYQVKEIKTATTDQSNNPKHMAAAQGEGDNIPIINGTNGEITNEEAANGEITNGDKKTMIYTTTYYVGIQLDKSKWSSIYRSASADTRQLHQRALTFHGKLGASKNSAPVGKTTMLI